MRLSSAWKRRIFLKLATRNNIANLPKNRLIICWEEVTWLNAVIRHPYHIASSCSNRLAIWGLEKLYSNEPNPQILYGALVFGPNRKDEFVDSRMEIDTVVMLDYNAGFTSALGSPDC